MLDKAPNLKIIAQASVGYDNIDVDACNKRGIVVCNTPRVLVDAVADMAYALILDTARQVVRGYKHVFSGKWGERKGLGFGVDLANKTLGIVGFGEIGCAVVSRALASKMKVIYYDLHKRDNDDEIGANYCDFEELLKKSDFILVAVDLNKSTMNMFSDEVFGKMKDGMRFINISRGKVVDTMALYNALQSKKIAYAAIDVVEPEPITIDHPLLKLDNITITPHIATSTVETRDAMAQLAAENILAKMANKPLLSEIVIHK